MENTNAYWYITVPTRDSNRQWIRCNAKELDRQSRLYGTKTVQRK